MKVAVVGAGAAGLACGRELQQKGHTVELFEKSRGPGGRMPTRWVGQTEADGGFDHGTQYFSAEHPTFSKCVNQAQQAGAVQMWNGVVVDLAYTQITPRNSTGARWVGVPGMSAFGRYLAKGLTLHTQTRVSEILRKKNCWALSTVSTSGEQQYCEGWDLVVLAVPAEQAVPFLAEKHEFQSQAAQIVSAPNWTVMLEFSEPLVVPFDAAFVHDLPIGWIARDSSKPGRADRERWVLQATSDWSSKHIELSADEAGRQLADVFLSALGLSVTPASYRAHRWLYSTPLNPLNAEFLLDPALGLAACGDWVKGPRVESAWLSGWALGQSISG
jgi:predicted NAD/FAD-dependent oxidoreductase